MSEETISRVFEPFFTTKPVGHGTGLGLSMVFGFAKQSNRHVVIESEPSKGTIVRLYLPRSNKLPTKEKPAADLEIVNQGAARLMLVEDDEGMRSLLTGFLENIGYQVTAFPTADDALESFLKNDNFDLLLTDLIVPGTLDGLSLGMEVQKRRKDIKVVFMSGYSDRFESDQKLIEVGDGFLAKPYEFKDLAKALAKALDTVET